MKMNDNYMFDIKRTRDEFILRLFSLDLKERLLLGSIYEQPEISCLGYLEYKNIFIDNMLGLLKSDLIHCVNKLCQYDFLMYDPHFNLLYLNDYLIRFPLKNANEGQKVERHFYKLTKKVNFYPILACDLLKMPFLTKSFRRNLKEYLYDLMDESK
ncbi:hypothetical protein [Rickettsiella endosymbiont of Dermanyssus gallinae]|uniref:hypothetical protein n=1 Tax=Rickettsiella endosymbiont of Dermanyssus gallinae TaxID=2856608 RepID=UPI001C52BEEC|nr:hypothetical protein [Rickettsiella endosymbiont of Dermanyssus gallinae]